MKCLALLALTSTALFAQSPALPNGQLPPPEKMPAPSASPTLSPTPKSAPPAPAPAPIRPAAETSPEARSPLDLLPAEDVEQALTLLKTHYVHSEKLSDRELARATLQGLLERLAPGISLVDGPNPNAAASPFRSEILGDSTGYLRLGDLSKNNLEALQAALKSFADKPVKSAILDLRATSLSSDYETAAEVIKRFCVKGNLLFTLQKSDSQPAQIFTSNVDPAFQGLLIVLVDHSTAGAGEVAAAVLRTQSKALVVGEKTAGSAVAFSDLPLPGGKILRVAVAEVALAGGASIYPGGVQPDIAIALPASREVLQAELEQGVAPLLTETARVRMNEAALVAGRNPELDALESAQRLKVPPKAILHDVQLQRALDLITTISLYEKKASPGK